MSCYFPIPPNIKDEKIEDKIYGSITLLNYPNNYKKSNLKRISKEDIYIGIYKLDECIWKLISIEILKYKEFKEIKRKDMSLSDSEMAVAVIRKNNDFALSCEELPIPSSLRVDLSPVAERASFNFSYRKVQTSFQGEFPMQMAKLNKASFFSFDGLKDVIDNSKIKNYILLMNLNISSKRIHTGKVKIYSPKTKSILYELEARENLISVHDISSLYKNNFSNDILFMCSKENAYIALMLNLDFERNQLSLEHTHPPAEMAIGMDRQSIVRQLKSNWLL